MEGFFSFVRNVSASKRSTATRLSDSVPSERVFKEACEVQHLLCFYKIGLKNITFKDLIWKLVAAETGPCQEIALIRWPVVDPDHQLCFTVPTPNLNVLALDLFLTVSEEAPRSISTF